MKHAGTVLCPPSLGIFAPIVVGLEKLKMLLWFVFPCMNTEITPE